MVTLQSADAALKSVYLGVVSNQLNTKINPLMAKIKQTTKDVYGKEVIKLAPYGLNGGFGAGLENTNLPKCGGNNYVRFVSKLRNLYGQIELTDKAIRASSNSIGAFVNLLNDEMDGLLRACSFNLGRMLYGDGSGLLATIKSVTSDDVLDSARNIMEGMYVDFYDGDTLRSAGHRVINVDRMNNSYWTEGISGGIAGTKLYVQGSKDNEITGLKKILETTGSLYGVNKMQHAWMVPKNITLSAGANDIDEMTIQRVLDWLSDVNDSEVDFIACSSGVRRAYLEYMATFKRNVDIMNLDGGFKSVSYNGIPLVADRFVPEGTMYLLNTKDFVIHQLCDWQWIENENGKVLHQKPGTPTYTAALVKYAELICDKPCGQGVITNIAEA